MGMVFLLRVVGRMTHCTTMGADRMPLNCLDFQGVNSKVCQLYFNLKTFCERSFLLKMPSMLKSLHQCQAIPLWVPPPREQSSCEPRPMGPARMGGGMEGPTDAAAWPGLRGATSVLGLPGTHLPWQLLAPVSSRPLRGFGGRICLHLPLISNSKDVVYSVVRWVCVSAGDSRSQTSECGRCQASFPPG